MNNQPFISEVDPDNPGWMIWKLSVPGLFNDFLGKIISRKDGDEAMVRMLPEKHHANLGGYMHGGAILGFIDVSLFAAKDVLSDKIMGYDVTVDLQTQFISAVEIDQEITAHVSITKETFSLMFMRGIVKQNDEVVASYTALVKKGRTPKDGKTQ